MRRQAKFLGRLIKCRFIHSLCKFTVDSVTQASYISECRAENQIKPRELVRCLECGYRILYKKRSKRMSIFEAR
ncbi:unnamed protein product [Taenia asiatica]|uniref:DNA-directed RNA polymerases I, II, and III subunit RPABC4 n=1 Tax=Taenia asiatica TaxID=60517 RepID=A0A0R3WGI3_TAEAS|nr:unnamed protein product [Taenia asiatica]